MVISQTKTTIVELPQRRSSVEQIFIYYYIVVTLRYDYALHCSFTNEGVILIILCCSTRRSQLAKHFLQSTLCRFFFQEKAKYKKRL